VDRKFKKKDSKDQQADFIRCVAMGKSGEFAEKYFHKGLKVAVCGRIQTGSYTNKDGNKVYTTDVIVEEQEFCESKANQQSGNEQSTPSLTPQNYDGFMSIPDGVDSELPFN
jgi:single-strand DNA-binding protein